MATNKKNGKIYIGQTVNSLKERNRLRKYGKTIFDNAFNKYGEDGFDWSIIDTATNITCLNKKESFWIDYYNSTNKNIGYNLMGGGDNAWKTDYVKHKIGIAQKGKLNHMYGIKYGDNKCSKRIIDIKTGIVYESLTYANDVLFTNRVDCISKISASCRGEASSYKGFYFRFIDNNDVISYTRFDEDDYIIKRREKERIVLYNLNGDFLPIEDIAKDEYERCLLLANSSHYKSKIIDLEIPCVKLSDIWVRKDVYDFFRAKQG